jgi:hypothetical protein
LMTGLLLPSSRSQIPRIPIRLIRDSGHPASRTPTSAVNACRPQCLGECLLRAKSRFFRSQTDLDINRLPA